MKRNVRFFAIALVFILISALLCACSSSSEKDQSEVSTPTAEEYDSGEAYENGAADGAAAATGSSLTGGFGEASTQKLIYTVTVNLETVEYDASILAVEKLCSELGGYTEYSYVSGESSGSLRYAEYTLRIPSDRLESFTDNAGDIGNVISIQRQTTNATSTYVDLEARLVSYQTEETRLLELLETAGDLDSLIALNSRLAEVRYQIESIESSLRNIDSQVSYSTVSIYLEEVVTMTDIEDVPRSFSERVASAFKTAKTSFVEATQSMGVFVFGTLPLRLLLILMYLLPLIIIAVVIILVRRRRRKKAVQTYYTDVKTDAVDDGGEPK